MQTHPHIDPHDQLVDSLQPLDKHTALSHNQILQSLFHLSLLPSLSLSLPLLTVLIWPPYHNSAQHSVLCFLSLFLFSTALSPLSSPGVCRGRLPLLFPVKQIKMAAVWMDLPSVTTFTFKKHTSYKQLNVIVITAKACESYFLTAPEMFRTDHILHTNNCTKIFNCNISTYTQCLHKVLNF